MSIMDNSSHIEKVNSARMRNSKDYQRKTNKNESKFRNFCGPTKFMLDVPNIDDGLKFLKHELDSSILDFSYNTMFLNEKIDRLNDIESNMRMPMELPMLYSLNMENDEDIDKWIKDQNKCDKENDLKSNKKCNHIHLTEKNNEYFSMIPFVSKFEKNDFDLLNKTIPNYIKYVKNNILNNEYKIGKKHMGDDIQIDNPDNALTGEVDKSNIKNSKVLYNHYFKHPFNKFTKVKNIYPIIPHISGWKGKYVQGVMEIESANNMMVIKKCDNNIKSVKYNGQGNDNQVNDINQNDDTENSRKLHLILHLVEKTRDKHVYGLYKNQEIDENKKDRNINIHDMDNFLSDGVSNEKQNDVIVDKIEKIENGHNVKNKKSTKNDANKKENTIITMTNSKKRKISLSKFLIKKHILKLQKLEKIKAEMMTSGMVVEGEINEKSDLLFKKNKGTENNGVGNLLKQDENNVDKFDEKEKNKKEDSNEDDHNKEQSDKQVEEVYENVQSFKYVRDYKSPSFSANEKDQFSYILSFSKKHKLAFLLPTISKKIIFSKTGQQKRNKFIILKE
ncbi:conserved Plasmodium protein, unknown function [Plasmodium berghei]|uniref:Uncharacterized protein n=2 Tax=Plasmodium berghei TaxID=5821 RepID=A0A509ARJ1_PLABA|nr:conserved Plasmodium protein, unknown function [Plasmodium berghei ANKA]CXJ04288.1 conserved Plasmodium protein, unknown function [Plasmodium berghei]SCM18665.1 conserved Plasmodium protein, unknown function [Plasmodium berghei]VUC57981.1 conserved Plasmodium protein, unknown function [Plasmodium berghei ANKA]|eukprot:XP_034423750.1 conserved Plasmodium protein, unknown function [Plasmodium berghei ANKA]